MQITMEYAELVALVERELNKVLSEFEGVPGWQGHFLRGKGYGVMTMFAEVFNSSGRDRDGLVQAMTDHARLLAWFNAEVDSRV